MKTHRDRCIALAGVFQVAELVSRIARQGIADTSAMECSIYSLFQTDAESVEAVYGGVPNLSTGLRILASLFDIEKSRSREISRYVISLFILEKKLSKDKQLLTKIADGIKNTSERLDHFPMLHQNIVAGLAELYTKTISNLSPRIMVEGESVHLQNPDNVNRIRTLLLAGLRSAILWRQCGGGRLHLILKHRKYSETAHELLNHTAHLSELK